MTPADVVFVRHVDGDWVGLYVNGALVLEGHSLRNDDVLDAIGVSSRSFETDVEARGGRCPLALRDVPEASDG